MPDVDFSTVVQLIARHILTSVGLWLAGHGYLDSSAVQGFVGAALMLGGIAWSVWQKDGVAFLVAEKKRLEDLLGHRAQVAQVLARAEQTAKAEALKAPPAPSVGAKP